MVVYQSPPRKLPAVEPVKRANGATPCFVVLAVTKQRLAEQLFAPESLNQAARVGVRGQDHVHWPRRAGNAVTFPPGDPLRAAPIVAPIISTARRIGSASK